MLRDVVLIVVGGMLLLGSVALGQGMLKTERYVDPAGVFQLDIPTGWYTEPSLDFDETEETVTDWSIYSRSLYIKPKEPIHPRVEIRISPSYRFWNGGEPFKNLDEVWKHRTIDQFNTYEWATVNGNRAIYNYLDFVGPAGVEAYKDRIYIVAINGVLLDVTFRESYRHDWNEGSAYDASRYIHDLERILNSISKPEN